MQNDLSSTKLTILFGLLVLAGSVTACGDSPASPSPPSPSPPPVAGDPPQACFSTQPEKLVITAGQTIALDAACTVGASPEASFSWELGDGRTERGNRVEASYRRPGDYDIRLVVEDSGMTASMTRRLRVNRRPRACFIHEQVPGTPVRPCTVRVDASCATGSLEEYEWFFQGGPNPPVSMPDATITTKEPVIEYSWAEDEACHSFRPFERVIRLEVIDESGVTDTHEDTVIFSSPALKR